MAPTLPRPPTDEFRGPHCRTAPVDASSAEIHWRTRVERCSDGPIVGAMWSRRTFLTTMIAGGVLAACGGNDSDGSDDPKAATPGTEDSGPTGDRR